MKLFTRISSLLALAGFLSVPGVAFSTGSHDGGHETPTFEATDKEFGAYQPDMKPKKTIEIKMSDMMKFSPEMITVNVGDVVEFTHTNDGKLMHEFVLGTDASLAEHAKMMQKFPNMEHEEPYMIHVGPGKEGKMLWKFTKKGEFAFGCLVPGHFEAGMRGTIKVEG